MSSTTQIEHLQPDVDSVEWTLRDTLEPSRAGRGSTPLNRGSWHRWPFASIVSLGDVPQQLLRLGEPGIGVMFVAGCPYSARTSTMRGEGLATMHHAIATAEPCRAVAVWAPVRPP